MEYPEHEKLQLVKDKSQEIGMFLEWLQYDKSYYIAQADNQGYFPVGLSTEDLLAEYFDIDLDIIEQEKRQMLDELRAFNDAQKIEKEKIEC